MRTVQMLYDFQVEVFSMKKVISVTVLGLSVLGLSLLGCNHNYEGEYLATEGVDCTLNSNINNNDVFLEISLQSEGYTAIAPRVLNLGLGSTSDGTASPSEDNILNFNFSKRGPRVRGAPTNPSPFKSVSMSIKVHPTKHNHILIHESYASLIDDNNGYINLLKADQKQPNYIPLCLIKKNTINYLWLSAKTFLSKNALDL